MNSAAPQIILDNIPSRLRQRDQWVLWQYATRDGKLTKIPFNARTGYEADATDPATWSTFEHAVEAHRKSSLWSGIGFVFSPDDPCCGVDLDDSIDPATGDFKPWAKTIIERLNSYCEISPSGVGVKLFLVATKPGARCRKGYEDGEVEIYDQERFFTVTGRRVDTISAEIEDRQEALVELYHQVFGEPEPPPPAPPPASNATRSTDLTDEQILEKAKRSRKTGQKFGDLWSGRWDGHFKSQSEGDSSLVFMIAFYTKDASQIDRMFRRCGLMRDKWDEKHGAKTYGQMTIDHALAQVSAQWQPAAARRASTDRDNAIWSPDHLSQQVNAERLVQILNGDARYNVNKGQWLWYDGRRFADDHGGEVARAAKRVARHTWRFVGGDLAGIEPKTAFKHALDSEKASGISAMMNLAQTEKGIPVLAEHFDADPYLFNCQNGTIDLGSGALRPHRRDDLLTKIAPVIYDPNAPRPLFSAFIERIMSQNQTMIAYLARLLGRCLSGDISEQELYFFIGEGANGKSVLVDTILGILGDYAGTAPESLLTVQAHSEHPTEIADLCGKRMVVASETEEGARLKVQLVKRLTGDGRLKARFMRQDFFEFDRTHKLIIVSNNKPLIRETKHAIWRRIRLVPFSVIIPEAERDSQLTEKLKAEWPGILSWLIGGYLDWRQSGMRTPQEVLMATQNYQSEQDPLGDYLADRCIRMDAARISRNELFSDYSSWCHQTSEKFPLSRNALFDHVRAIKGVSEDQWRLTGQSSPVRGFRGIGLAYSGNAVADFGE